MELEEDRLIGKEQSDGISKVLIPGLCLGVLYLLCPDNVLMNTVMVLMYLGQHTIHGSDRTALVWTDHIYVIK